MLVAAVRCDIDITNKEYWAGDNIFISRLKKVNGKLFESVCHHALEDVAGHFGYEDSDLYCEAMKNGADPFEEHR